MITLSRGLNPDERAWAEPTGPGHVPFELLHGTPSYINVLDALGAWDLVGELSRQTGEAACASLKHTSPAAVALGHPFAVGAETFYDRGPLPGTALGRAVLRTRSAVPQCSYGDFVAVSEPVGDEEAPLFANAIGVIAPGYSPSALAFLRRLNGGHFIVLSGNRRPGDDHRDVPVVQDAFGLRLTREIRQPTEFAGGIEVVCGELRDPADLAVAVLAVKHAQSNAMVFATAGQTIGIGMGQQNRLDCARLAGGRARVWQRRFHPDVLGLRLRPEVAPAERAVWRSRLAEGDLTPSVRAEFAGVLQDPHDIDAEPDWAGTPPLSGVTLAADNHFPFVEVVELAARHGVTQLVTPRGSTAPARLREACEQYGMSWIVTGDRFFKH
jgi:phosphoribosylaminoimidazolecarboxamide formyltransferase/IMP cyclohydrolase